MKVLHVISSSGMYGAEAVILNLSRALSGMHHETALGVFYNSAHPSLELYDRAQQEGISAYRITCKGQFDRSVPNAIRELVRSTNADVLHAHGYKSDLYCYFAAGGTSIPLVATCHTWYDNDVKVWLYGVLDRFVLRSFAGVVAVSEEVKQRLLAAGVPSQRIRLIRNGIGVESLHARFHSDRGPEGMLHVGLVGRLSREKGIDIYLRAAARVLTSMPQVQFSVAGDGPDREALQVLIKALGIHDQARLLGRLDDLGGFYRSLDLLVSASRQEGLPMALLEGAASGLPVVATPVGEVPSIVKDELTGIIVPSEDVEALAEAMRFLLRSPERRSQMGAAARELVVKEFSSNRMAQEHLELYKEVMDRRYAANRTAAH